MNRLLSIRNALLPLAFLASWSALRAAPAPSPLSVTALEPTVLFTNEDPIRQIARLTVVNSGTSGFSAKVSVASDRHVQSDPQTFNFPPGVSKQDLKVPDAAAPCTLDIEITGSDGTAPATWSQDWIPQRKWKVYVIKSSHEDIGYEDFIFNKQKQIADYIDLARKLSGPKEKAPDEPGKPTTRSYHYTLETLLFERNYIDERSEAAWRDIVETDLKPGRMDLMGAPSSDHTQWMDYEELARTTYPGRREEKDRFGLDLKTFMIVDNPSASWSACQAIADAGFHYLLRLGQPWRAGGKNDYATTKLPALFWWEAPDRHSRVLYAWRNHYGTNFWFGQSGGGFADLTGLASQNVDAELKKIQSGDELGPYPYDAVIVPSYEDHEIPSWDDRALRLWQKTYRFPEIRIGGATGFFEYIEGSYGEKLPVLRGELNNFSGDYATIDPTAQGWKRRASRLLPEAEGVAALANRLDPAFAPDAPRIERTYARLSDFTEHSWPTSPRVAGHHLFNAQWVKHQEAARALDAAGNLADNALKALFARVPTGHNRAVAVFNPLAHPRSGLVEAPGVFPSLIDDATGKPALTQVTGTDQTLLIAENVPAYGYKTFTVSQAAATPPDSPLAAAADTISNQFYTIKFDAKTGAVTSIFDKELNRELVDAAALYKFNQMVWVRKDADGQQGNNIAIAPGATLASTAGAARVEMTAHMDDPATGGSITQTVALYNGLKRIDVTDDIRHLRALATSQPAQRYRENIYYAFPVDVPDFTARAEYPGGVVRPFDDQLRWGSHDFLNVNWWTDVSNGKFGVTMSPWEATTVNFGAIRYNEFSIDYKPAASHLFSYAWSNRMAGLIELAPDEWNTTLHYSFTSHAGDWNGGGATDFGWSVASPLRARVLGPGQTGPLPAVMKSFVSVDAANVQLVTLKQTLSPGRGWILRLAEVEGKSATATVDLSFFPVQTAALCNLVEEDQKPLAVKDGKVTVAFTPFSFVTIRFQGAEVPVGATGPVKIRALSDRAAKLSWNKVPEAASYFVYRSEDPGAPPTAYNLAARTVKPEFSDEALKIDTAYSYRVAAVTAANEQGPVSDAVVVRTEKKALSPPPPVAGLGIVRYSSTQLKIYWDKSPEPDVARYVLYRGEKPQALGKEPLATVPATKLFLQTFLDAGLKPAVTYYYQVFAEDWAGHRQPLSPETSATTAAASDGGPAPAVQDQ